MTNAQAMRFARARGFTLTELLVAVAAVGLLTVGIGQIFRSVSRLTGGGQAVAEVDAFARAIESQLRADFDAFSRLPPEETFLVIRMREEGDINRDGDLLNDAGEKALYLSPEDRDFDREAGVGAYGTVTLGATQTRSRAVTRRLDDMAFIGLAPADQPYRSAQTVQSPDLASSTPTARQARLYWGHALRPRTDPNPQQNPQTGQIVPARQYIPDGTFGDRAGDATTIGYPGFTGTVIATGRNEFASRWLLARQPMLLFGGTAAGAGGADPSPLGQDIEYAPFIRDYESFFFNVPNIMRPQTGQNPNYIINDPAENGYPNPRFAFHGRTDVCAQDASDLRRWLEGEADFSGSQGNRQPPFAGAFSTGFYADPSFSYMNGRLWLRARGNPANAQTTIDQNLFGLRSAIAGVMARPQADDAPARIDRAPANSNALLDSGEAPEDALMDLHAIIASRCSNFEIAWSDGTRAKTDIAFDNDPDTLPDYAAGDLIWFDVSPVVINGQTKRSTYRQWQAEAAFNTARGSVEPPFPQFPDAEHPRIEVPNGDHFPGTGEVSANTLMRIEPDGSTGLPGCYHVSMTGGAPVSTGNPNPNEVVCVWGYRLPTGDGGYGAPWPKPKFIRVRVTLHDAQFRLPGGKQYEFVFALNPAPSL